MPRVLTVLLLLCWAPAWGQVPASQPSADPLAVSAGEEPPQEEEATDWPPGLLMEGLDAVGAKDPLEVLGFRVWGFVQTGFMGRLTGGQDPLPMRVFDARRPNNLRLHQLRLTLDRPYDSSKSFDIGGRIDGLFGGDAMLTHSPGLFDKAGHGDGDAWADLLQGYGQAWFKTGESSGLEVTVGKWVTTHGMEVIDATGNALYSRSYLFGYAIPFTHTGVKANYVFNDQASAYVAVVEGWEVWNDNNNAVSYMTGGALSSADKKTNLYVNLITGPEQDDDVNNFRTVFDVTLSHAWTDKLTQAINVDYGTEENVPDVGRANWYGAAHYFTYVFNEYVSGTWRAEWFRDEDGARTGVATSYYENTLGLAITPFPNHKTLKYLTVRPEVRWDFACDPAFGDDHENQVTTGFDVIYRF